MSQKPHEVEIYKHKNQYRARIIDDFGITIEPFSFWDKTPKKALTGLQEILLKRVNEETLTYHKAIAVISKIKY